MTRPTTVQKFGDNPVAANPLPTFSSAGRRVSRNYLTQIPPKIPSNKETDTFKGKCVVKYLNNYQKNT